MWKWIGLYVFKSTTKAPPGIEPGTYRTMSESLYQCVTLPPWWYDWSKKDFLRALVLPNLWSNEMPTQLLCKIFFANRAESYFQTFFFFCIFPFPFLCLFWGQTNLLSSFHHQKLPWWLLISSAHHSCSLNSHSQWECICQHSVNFCCFICPFVSFFLVPSTHYSCSLNPRSLLLLILVMLFYSLQSEIKRQLRLFVVSRDCVTNSLHIAASVYSLWHWCMPQVAVCRHIFIKVAWSATVTCSDLLENDIKCVYWQDNPTRQVSFFSKKPFLSNGILCNPKFPLTYCV